MATGQRILVTGPARSGKSEWAEWLAQQSQQPVTYVATAQTRADDPEWQARIEAHRQRRPPSWRSLEIPLAVSAALAQAQTNECWLVDSLGTWLANHLDQPEIEWKQLLEQTLAAVATFPGTLILVAEETGWGVVPAYPAGRVFRDRLGTLTRRIGAMTDKTYLVVAGYAVDLHAVGHLVPSRSHNTTA